MLSPAPWRPGPQRKPGARESSMSPSRTMSCMLSTPNAMWSSPAGAPITATVWCAGLQRPLGGDGHARALEPAAQLVERLGARDLEPEVVERRDRALAVRDRGLCGAVREVDDAVEPVHLPQPQHLFRVGDRRLEIRYLERAVAETSEHLHTSGGRGCEGSPPADHTPGETFALAAQPDPHGLGRRVRRPPVDLL